MSVWGNLAYCLALIAPCMCVCVRAQDNSADFFRDKQIRFIVGASSGGTYDLFARAMARFMPAHIPGNPSIIVQSQPAAGGLVMANQIYNQGPRDGTVIGVPTNGVPTAPRLQSGALFDAAKLIWLGSTNRDPYVGYVWHTAPVTHIKDMATRELIVGATTTGVTLSDFPMLLNELFGYRFKVVRGYGGSQQINMAMERGEIQGNAGFGLSGIKAQTPEWLSSGKIRLFVQYNLLPHPELADVPAAMDLARNEDDRRAMRLLFARTEYARPYFLPPGVPRERVEILRRAFDETLKDPGLLEEVHKLQFEASPMTGEALQTMIADLAATPDEISTRVRKALEAPDGK